MEGRWTGSGMPEVITSPISPSAWTVVMWIMGEGVLGGAGEVKSASTLKVNLLQFVSNTCTVYNLIWINGNCSVEVEHLY